MKSDELFDLSKTIIPFGKKDGPFYMKRFEEVALRDLDWLVGQDWLKDPIKSKLVAYLKKTPIQRAIEKEIK